jgi:two-component system, response regulator
VTKLILLVEDNPDDAALALRTIGRHANYVVIVAQNGAEALDFLFGTGDYQGRDLSIDPDLVLLDLKLPKVSGLEVLRQIRENARTRELQVVMFTSSTEEQDVETAYRLGVNSFLSKPVDYRQYRDTLTALLERWVAFSVTSIA